eukprot:5310429-Prymnesium_polylepis.1
MSKFLIGHGCQLQKAAPTIAKSAQLGLHADVVDNGDGLDYQLECEHGECEKGKEQEEALCRIAKTVAAAGFWGELASLDHQHTQVKKDEG